LTTSTRQNKIISLIGGGSSNAANRYIEDELIADGWASYVNARVDNEVYFGADETWFYLPWGTVDINAYDFCGLQACTGALARVANVGEFQQGMTTMHRATGKPIGFYMGNPAADPTLSPLWTSSRTAWYQRVEAAVFPIGLIKARGVPVRFGIDAVGNGVGADQCAALLEYLSGYGLVWYEPRPLVQAGSFNVARYGSITADFAFRDDYAGFGQPPIPEAQLAGPRMLLCLGQRMPGDYAHYVRGVGTVTGADVAVSNNAIWRGKLRANAFRVTVR
jgi:hypothetical protein